MVSSYPDDVETTDRMAWELRESFEWADLAFKHFEVLDRRTASQARRIIRRANFVILCGGHVPTENAFFHDINLRELLHGFRGVVMGLSAGSMNCAYRVYAPPELEGEAINPDYQRYMDGLGLTRINILPHFQTARYSHVDGQHLVRKLMTPDSYRQPIYCIPDGTYFVIEDGATYLCGEAYRLRYGHLNRICHENQCKRILPSGRMFSV